MNLPPALLAQIAAIKVLCDYIVDSEAVNDPRRRAHVVLQFREQGAVVAGITHRALLRVVVCGHLVDCVNFRCSGHRYFSFRGSLDDPECVQLRPAVFTLTAVPINVRSH